MKIDWSYVIPVVIMFAGVFTTAAFENLLAVGMWLGGLIVGVIYGSTL